VKFKKLSFFYATLENVHFRDPEVKSTAILRKIQEMSSIYSIYFLPSNAAERGSRPRIIQGWMWYMVSRGWWRPL